MAADAVTTKELKLLREELLATQKAAASAKEAMDPPEGEPAPKKEAPDQQDVSGKLAELADEALDFFTEAEKNIAAHPTSSIIGAFLVGILIGHLLGRR